MGLTEKLVVQRDMYSYSTPVSKDISYADALVQVVNGGGPTNYYQIDTHFAPQNAYTTCVTKGCTFTYNGTKYVSYLSGYGTSRLKYMLVAKLNPSAGYSSITATFYFEP